MSCSEEEILTCLKASVLDENRPLLCNTLSPKLHYPYLRSKHVLSEDDEEIIEIQQLRKQKVHKMIDILMKKGRKGFDELVISIIQEKTQIFLAESLNKAFEEKRKRLLTIKSQNIDDVSSVGSVRHVPASEQTIEDLRLNTTSMESLPQFSVLYTDINCKNSLSLHDSESDMDKLPKPTMSKNTEEDLKLYRKKSCENSFDEDLDEVESISEGKSSENESKA